jgi:hypothetical protein
MMAINTSVQLTIMHAQTASNMHVNFLGSPVISSELAAKGWPYHHLRCTAVVWPLLVAPVTHMGKQGDYG